jgi:preprotein translocase subunit SecF
VASLLFVGTYVLGGLALRDFALALFVGLLTGAYSSIFVATPILAWLKEREPKYRALRERAAADLAKAQTVAPVAPVAPGPAVDVPVDGEDIEPLDDDDHDDDDDLAIAARATPPEPVTPSVAPRASTGSASRGTANPRGRQQRRRKRR